MRILMFLHSFAPGGVERVALRLACAWTEAGEDVRVVIGRDAGAQRSIAPTNVAYEFAEANSFAQRFEALWLVAQVVRAVRRQRPDVLFCAGSTYTIVAALLKLLLGDQCPPIVAKISNSLERKDLPWFARVCLRLWYRCHPLFIDRVVGMDTPMREEIASCMGMPVNRISIIPDPAISRLELQTPRRRTAQGRTGARYVAVGRLAKQKNFALLLRAFAEIRNRHDRLIIIGEGPERSRLLRLAQRLEVKEQVDMPGHLESATEALSTADVFVCSSNYEGLPGAIVEALAAGLPIVATDCSACMGHLLAYGALGRLVRIRDAAALGSAMVDAAKEQYVPASAMRSAAARFTIERSAPAYLDVLAASAVESTCAVLPVSEVAEAV